MRLSSGVISRERIHDLPGLWPNLRKRKDFFFACREVLQCRTAPPVPCAASPVTGPQHKSRRGRLKIIGVHFIMPCIVDDAIVISPLRGKVASRHYEQSSILETLKALLLTSFGMVRRAHILKNDH